MRSALFCVVGLCVACGGSTPPPEAPSAPKHAAAPTGAARPLTEDECDALSQWLLEACHDRGNDRSSQDEGWCSDIERRTLPSDRSWIKACAGHVTAMDDACFRSTKAVRTLMDCDAQVSW